MRRAHTRQRTTRSITAISKFIRTTLRYLLHRPAIITRLTIQILIAPSKFAREYVDDDSDKRLIASFKFYVEIFSIAFVLTFLASRFQLYEGISEIRHFITLLLQLMIGVPIIYFALILGSYRLTFPGVLQISLYVDGVFILFEAAFNTVIAYFDYLLRVPIPLTAVDIFATEYERCLSQESLMYWLIRGDLQFLIYSDVWRSGDWYRRAFEYQDYFQYIIVAPFLLIFSQMIRARYGGRIVVLTSIAAFGFIVAVETARIAIDQTVNRIMVASNCNRTFLDQIAKKYSITLIAQQIEYKLNNELRRELPGEIRAPFLRLRAVDFVFSAKLNRAPEIDWVAFVSQLDNGFKGSYCSNHVHWEMMRRINHNLVVLFTHWNDDRVVYAKRFEPQVCEPNR